MLTLEDRVPFMKFLNKKYEAIHCKSKHRIFYLLLFYKTIEEDEKLFKQLCDAAKTERGLKEDIGAIENGMRKQCKVMYPNLKFSSVTERNFFNDILPSYFSEFEQKKNQYKSLESTLSQ